MGILFTNLVVRIEISRVIIKGKGSREAEKIVFRQPAYWYPKWIMNRWGVIPYIWHDFLLLNLFLKCAKKECVFSLVQRNL